MRRLLATLVLLSTAVPALAQQPERLPPFVFDARGVFAFLGTDPVTSTSLNVTVDDLAGHGLGLNGGVHVYPLRRPNWALGLGGEVLLAGATKQRFDPIDPTVELGPEVHRQIRSLSGQLSFNFGHRHGWSYLTAGIGPLRFDTHLPPSVPDGLKPMTQNFGFGARWFSTPHVALNVDMRFYLTQPANATLLVGGRERATVTVISAGISLK
jgi:hypothetical protein